MATILLTGPAGLLGSAVGDALAASGRSASGAHRVIQLWHRIPPDPPGDGVRGDITAARLGLPGPTYRQLLADVDTVVHCAAITDFGADPDRIWEANVEGTRHVATFAAQAEASFCHVSTAYVASPADTIAGAYVRSKRAAERVARSVVPDCLIVRPSIVIGEGGTRRQGVHALISAALSGTLPVLPMAETTPVDLIPKDLVARAIAELVLAGCQPDTYWLTAGPATLTAAELVRCCQRAATAHGIDMPAPRFVPPDVLERLIRPVFLASLPKGLRHRVDRVLALVELLARTEPFRSDFHRVPHHVAVASDIVRECFRATVCAALPARRGVAA